MDFYVLMAQINLVFQFVILGLLSAGLVFKRRNRFFSHGVTMLIAVVLNAFSFVLVMGPTFLRSGPSLRANPLNRLSLVTLGHAGAGSLAEILGIWVVASWRLRPSTGKCVGKKKVMLAIALLWLTAILLGILLYVLLYTTML